MTTPQLAPYLTLDEAALAISNTLGTSWTVSDLIGYAYRNEISICARISTGATLVRVESIKGEENTIIAEAGSLTFISAKSCRALLLTGQAEFTEMTYPSSVNLAGKLTEAMVTVWMLADGETAPTFGIDDCRVSSDGVLQLISKQTALKDLSITKDDNFSGEKKAAINITEMWIAEAWKQGTTYMEAWRNAGYEPTIENIGLYVEGVFSNNRTYNTRGNVIDRATIIREALTGITKRGKGTKSRTPNIPDGKAGKLPEK